MLKYWEVSHKNPEKPPFIWWTLGATGDPGRQDASLLYSDQCLLALSQAVLSCGSNALIHLSHTSTIPVTGVVAIPMKTTGGEWGRSGFSK